MVFNSLTFVVFFACVLALHALPLPWTTKKINLAVASYLFYAAWNPPFVILLWVSTVVDWYAAQGLVKAKRPTSRHAWMLPLRHRPAGGHLLLYVRDHVVHPGRVPAARGAGTEPARLRAVRDLLSAPGGRSDHAPDGAGAAVRAAAPRHRGAAALRAGAHDPRPLQQDRARRQFPRERRGACLRQRQDPGGTRRLGGDAGVQRSDLLRLRRLFDHRDRRGAVPGICHAGQLPLPLRGGGVLGLLAPLAYHTVLVAARLPLHSARRQSSRCAAHLCRAHDHHVARGPVARRELDLRRLGRPAWCVPRRRARAARALR